MIYEAKCKKCGETFNPQPSLTTKPKTPPRAVAWIGGAGFTRDDLEHGMNESQTEVCGGEGELTGSWG